MTVYLVYNTYPYEGLGYPNVHANFKSALLDATSNLGHIFDREHYGISIHKTESGVIEFVELLDMNFDHPERGHNYSDIYRTCISEEKVIESEVTQ